jgi:hypothetical protein
MNDIWIFPITIQDWRLAVMYHKNSPDTMDNLLSRYKS